MPGGQITPSIGERFPGTRPKTTFVASLNFVYDGDQVVLETNGSNTTTLYRTPGVGFVRNGAQRYDYETNQGSSVVVRDVAGAWTGLSEYDAYGREVFWDDMGDRGSYRFGGKHGYANDDATGMQLLGARYYLPAVGRFLTQDPTGQEGGLNLYAYCNNSPLLRLDPSGNDWDWAKYSHDVMGVFAGYGRAAYGAAHSPVDLAQFLGTWAGTGWDGDFGKRSAYGAWTHFYGGLIGERGAYGFGDSFGSALIAAGSTGAGFAEGGMFSKFAYVTRWDTTAGIAAIKESGVFRAGSFVQRGRGNLLDYLLTGTITEGYPFGSKITKLVPKSVLGAPRGWEAGKYLFRQRILVQTYKF